MDDEFTKTGVNTVASSQGFAVEVKFLGGLCYCDDRNKVKIDSEWLVNPDRFLIHKPTIGDKGFETMDQSRIDAMLDNVVRALQFLGYQVEI